MKSWAYYVCKDQMRNTILNVVLKRYAVYFWKMTNSDSGIYCITSANPIGFRITEKYWEYFPKTWL